MTLIQFIKSISSFSTKINYGTLFFILVTS